MFAVTDLSSEGKMIKTSQLQSEIFFIIIYEKIAFTYETKIEDISYAILEDFHT